MKNNPNNNILAICILFAAIPCLSLLVTRVEHGIREKQKIKQKTLIQPTYIETDK